MPETPTYEEKDGTDVTGASYSINSRGIDSMTTTVLFNPKSEFAKFIDRIIERRLAFSDLECTLIKVRKYKRIGVDYDSGKPSAVKQKAVIVPTSFAPGNADLNSEIKIKFIDNPTFGTFTPGERNADYQWLYPAGVFAAETSEPTASQIHYKDGDATRSDYGIFFEFDNASI